MSKGTEVAVHQSAISATVSHKSEIFPATSGESISATVLPKSEKSPTVSDKFVTPAEDIISRLSFAHIRQLMTVDDPLAGMDNKLFVSTYMLSLPDKATLEEFLLREIDKR